jgi:hypothetical protein
MAALLRITLPLAIIAIGQDPSLDGGDANRNSFFAGLIMVYALLRTYDVYLY